MRQLLFLGGWLLSSNFFSGRSGLLGDCLGRFNTGGLSASGGLFFETGSFVLVNNTFFKGFVEVALSAVVGFGRWATGEELKGTLKTALSFTVADGRFVGGTNAFFG